MYFTILCLVSMVTVTMSDELQDLKAQVNALKGIVNENVARLQATESKLTKADVLGQQLKLQLVAASSKIKGLTSGGGAVYVRWGRNDCPGTAKQLYNGYMGGSYYGHAGGGANYLCLPKDPEWAKFKDGIQSASYIYGTEYETSTGANVFSRENNGGLPLHDLDAVCVVCQSSLAHHVMIPAKKTCPPGWTQEYWGYLMAERAGHPRSSDFICVDGTPEVRNGSKPNHNGALLYNVEAQCGSLPCPQYVYGRELTCTVCTK